MNPAQNQNPPQDLENKISFNINDVKPLSEIGGTKQTTSETLQAKPEQNSKESKISKNTLAGMYQGAGGHQKLSLGFDFDFKALLNYTIVIINLALIGLLVFFVLIPQYNLYVENQTKIIESRESYEKVDAHYKYLKSLESLQDDLYRNLDLSKQSIPEEEDVPQFLNQISIMAKQSSVDLSKNDFSGASLNQPPTKPTNSNEKSENDISVSIASSVNVRSTVTGTYSELIDFLARLESARRLTVVNDLKLSEKVQDKNVTKLGIQESQDIMDNQSVELVQKEREYNLDLTLSGYYMADPKISQLTIDQLVAKREIPQVINTIQEMNYHELTDIVNINYGRDNPFAEDLENIEITPIPTPTLDVLNDPFVF